MGKKADAAAVVRKRPAAASAPPTIDMPSVGKMPIFSVEASRSQVLFRSGLPGKGQGKVFTYSDEASKKRALASAREMVDAEKRRRRL
jgi:hypothetical protein